jgi:hypothetical protein
MTVQKLALLLMGLVFFNMSSVPDNKWLEYIPKKEKVIASVMQVKVPEEYEAISQKYIKSIKAHINWYEAYKKQHNQENEILPYHVNMGITKDEYELLVKSCSDITLIKASELELSFVKQENGSIKLITNPVSPIHGIMLDATGSIITKDGILKESESTVVDKESPTGAWRGVSWMSKFVDEVNGEAKVINFSLGKREAGTESMDQYILHYDVLEFDQEKQNQFSAIMYYPAL